MTISLRWITRYRRTSLLVLALLLLAPLAFWARRITARTPETGRTAAPPPAAVPASARAAGTAASSAKPAMASVNITPFLDCVEDHGNGTFTAYFGYESFEAAVVQVLVGIENRFIPNPQDRGQPVLFFPGLHKSAFRITSATTMVWSFAGHGVTVVAGMANTHPCRPPPPPPVVADIVPFVESVTVNGSTGTATVTFGYENSSSNVITLAAGSPLNRLSRAGDQTQPAQFQPGLQRNAYTTTFPATESLFWMVQGLPALAVPGTCPTITMRVR